MQLLPPLPNTLDEQTGIQNPAGQHHEPHTHSDFDEMRPYLGLQGAHMLMHKPKITPKPP